MTMPNYPKDVTLKDGRQAAIRQLKQDDLDALHRFFLDLPEEERIFLRHDVTDKALLEKWTANQDFEHVVPLVACDEDAIIGEGTLHIEKEGWMQHVGSVRLVIAPSHRGNGLGTLMTRELVQIAQFRSLEKLRANVIEKEEFSIKMLAGAGFKRNSVLHDLAKDRKGRTCNVVVMVNDVADLTRILEDWIHDAMIPAFRAPSGGHS